MANPEHLAKLQEGVEAWNEWRRQAPDIVPDLYQAKLVGAELRGADLSGVNLSGADLSCGNLISADLIGADLREADLSRAGLVWADLSGALLGWASMTFAGLLRTNLRSADLRGTDLSGSTVDGTCWVDLNLSETVGLHTVEHTGPSSIGVDTLRKSRGRIPEAFLRGCGLADWEILSCRLYDPCLREDERTDIVYEIVRLQQGQPIMFHSVFISYSTSDQEFATKLHGDLQHAGVRCWFAPHDIAGGKKIHEQIDRAIQVQDRLLLILSEASMASEWVKTEIAHARAKEREQKRQVLFPIRLVPFDEIRKWKAFDADIGKDSAREIREYFIPDFSNWQDEVAYEPAFERLLKDLRTRDDHTHH